MALRCLMNEIGNPNIGKCLHCGGYFLKASPENYVDGKFLTVRPQCKALYKIYWLNCCWHEGVK